MAEGKDNREMNGRGGMLSVVDLRDAIVPKQEVDKYLNLFEERNWKEIKKFGEKKRNYEKKCVIKDYSELNLTPFSYDLSVGHQLFSIQSPEPRVITITEDHSYKLEPGETVVIITRELIAIPYYYSATVWPRFDFVREGIFQSMVKTDPTWYGQLGVALTNLSPAEYPIWKEKRFATLILYELSSPTDINLFRKGKTLQLDENKSIQGVIIPKDVEKDVNKKIGRGELKGKCRIENGKLTIQVALDRKELKLLSKQHESEEWHKAVEEAVRTKSCNALGLPALDLLFERPTAGEKPESPRRLTRGDVTNEASKCTTEALSKMAVERGRPFELVANMPRLTEEYARGQVEIELNKEISKIILRIMAITISILGFISLIVAIIALVARRVAWKLPIDVDWNDTLSIAMIGVALVLVIIMVFIFSPWRGRKGVAKVRGELREVNIELREKLKGVDDKLRDKTVELWKEIESIKSRIEKAKK